LNFEAEEVCCKGTRMENTENHHINASKKQALERNQNKGFEQKQPPSTIK